jgi:23S rRNA (uridine2552-2'-O)-methyltransferase
MFNPQDFYFKKAKKEGYKARSIFKLEEIDKKFHFFDKRKTVNVLDIGCAPGSWLQYVSKVTNRNSKVI